jgi:hypothetical protein
LDKEPNKIFPDEEVVVRIAFKGLRIQALADSSVVKVINKARIIEQKVDVDKGDLKRVQIQ